MTYYLIVTDCNHVTVDCYPTDKKIFTEEEISDFLSAHGHKESECSWMGPCELNLKIHNKI